MFLNSLELGDLATWIGVAVSLVWNFVNTCLALWHQHVHIRLIPKAGLYEPDLDGFNTRGVKDLKSFGSWNYAWWQNIALPVWEIVNLSTFSVYIAKVGFCKSKFVKSDSQDILYLLTPRLIAGPVSLKSELGNKISLPVKLESREPLVLAAENIEIVQAAIANRYKYMFVETSCGKFRFVNALFFLKFFKIRHEEYEEPSMLA